MKRIYFNPSLSGQQRLFSSLNVYEVVCRTERVTHVSQFMYREYAYAILYSYALQYDEKEYKVM